MSGQVHITIEYDCTFAIDELWPDGDAPEVITRDDVLALIEHEGPYRLPSAWGFPKHEGPYRLPSAWGFPKPSVRIGFSGFDVLGRVKHAEQLWVRGS